MKPCISLTPGLHQKWDEIIADVYDRSVTEPKKKDPEELLLRDPKILNMVHLTLHQRLEFRTIQ